MDNPFIKTDQTDVIVEIADVKLHLNSQILASVCDIESTTEWADEDKNQDDNATDVCGNTVVSLAGYTVVDVVRFFKIIYPGCNGKLKGIIIMYNFGIRKIGAFKNAVHALYA